MRGISLLAERLLASQEGLFSMELVRNVKGNAVSVLYLGRLVRRYVGE
jgi:hypothetical protein